MVATEAWAKRGRCMPKTGGEGYTRPALKLVHIEVVRSLYGGKYGKTNECIIRQFLGHWKAP